MSCGLLFGQTTNVGSIVSSYTITTPSGFTGQVFSTLGLTVYYPTGLATSSYITSSQLNSDFQGFLSAYPSPTDAPEAYLSGALQGILTKYPQILAGELRATVSGPPQMIGGITIPNSGTPIGSVTVLIGNFGSALSTVLVGLPAQSINISTIFSSWSVSTPAGFTGQSFSSIELGLTYPTGLPSGSYITRAQLNTDFQGSISAYPTPSDAPEAYLSGALQSILSKYTQIPGGVLGATISGPGQMIGGITVPGTGTEIGSITVAIGDFSNSLGSLLYAYYGQSGPISSISSSWAVSLPMNFAGQSFSSIQLGVVYPTGLPAASYIKSTQLNSDFQGFISAYPSPADAPEAYLSTTLQQILNQYSQMPGGEVVATIAGQGTSIGGITIPGAPSGSVTVTIGAYNPTLSTIGLLGFLSRTASVDTTQHVSPAHALHLPPALRRR